MPKKSSGFLPFALGLAAGAAGIFFSKKENRSMASKEFKKAKTKAQELAKEYRKDPTTAKKKVVAAGKKLAKKAVTSIKAANKSQKKKTSSKRAKR